MNRLHQAFITILTIITFILCGIIIWILLFRQTDIPKLNIAQKGEKGDPPTAQQIAVAVSEYLAKNPVINGRDGISGQSIQGPSGPTGKSGVDGVSIKGDKGSSCSVAQIETGAVIACDDGTNSIVYNGSNGIDGKTPMFSCGDNGYWMIRYTIEDRWQLLNDVKTSCSLKEAL